MRMWGGGGNKSRLNGGSFLLLFPICSNAKKVNPLVVRDCFVTSQGKMGFVSPFQIMYMDGIV